MFTDINGDFLCQQYNCNRKDYLNELSPYTHTEAIKYIDHVSRYVKDILTITYPCAQKGETKLLLARKDYSVIQLELCANYNEGYLKITKAFLKNVFKVQLFTSNNEMNISWQSDNLFLNPKPIFKENSKNHDGVRATYFQSLFQNPQFSDIKIEVEGKIFPLHKIILAQCYYFREMLIGPWKESKQSEIKFSECNQLTFHNFVEYLYNAKVNEEYFTSPQNCIDMLQLTHQLNFKPLVEISKERIFNLISEECFIDIAHLQNTLEDKDLEELCQWFVRKNPTFGDNLDLKTLNILDLNKVYQFGKKYKINTLLQATEETIIKNFKLEDNFVEMCDIVIRNKDIDLKNVMVKALKHNPSLIETLEKKGEYKSHWKAYKKLMTNSYLLT